MVCCTLLAALLGLIFRPFFASRSSALAWRRPSTLNRAANPSSGFVESRWKSFGYAFAGLRFVIRNETNMRIHLLAAALAIALGISFDIGPEEWRWIFVAILIVLAAEVFNTAVEQACNALGTSYNRAVGHAKDAAAGAVLLSAVGALLIGLTVFVPHLSRSAANAAARPTLDLCGARLR